MSEFEFLVEDIPIIVGWPSEEECTFPVTMRHCTALALMDKAGEMAGLTITQLYPTDDGVDLIFQHMLASPRDHAIDGCVIIAYTDEDYDPEHIYSKVSRYVHVLDLIVVTPDGSRSLVCDNRLCRYYIGMCDRVSNCLNPMVPA